MLPFIIQPIEFSNLHQKRQNLPIPACELRHHLPKRFGKSLAFFAFGRYAVPLKPYRLALQVMKGFNHLQTAGLIKTAPDMIKRPVVKMLNQPVERIIHLKVYDNVGILFKIYRLHLEHLGLQRLDLPQGFRQDLDLFLHGGYLLRERLRNIGRSVQGAQSVFDIVQ